MNDVITIILAILSSSTVSTVITAIFTRISEKNKHKDGLYIAERQTYYRRIKQDGKQFIERGFIYADELEDLIEDHRVYHDVLGGNGFLDGIMNQVKALPIK